MTDPTAQTVTVRAIDVVVCIELAGSGADRLAAAVRRAWTRCLLDDDGAAAEATVRAVLDDDPGVLAAARADGATASDDLEALMEVLSPLVTVAAIDRQAGSLLLLHAGGLATPDGRTVAFVAPSGTGKTTLTRTLGTGYGYVSDETLAVRADGTVAVYPKPLSIRPEGGTLKGQVDAGALGLLPAPAACSLHAVVVLERDGSEEPWFERVPVVRALAVLASETSYLSRMERPLHRLAATVPGGLRVLHYAEAADTADLVAGLFAGEAS